ncbi:MAG TPA: DNA primase [Desulfobaccales bacterium]|nr:DNA primase [Desulfobaccales bacterium]
MAFIPEDKLLEIKDAASIEEVVGQYVKLTPRGKNLLGLCPFHADTSPSFTVAPEKGIFHCFGCGAGGNVFSFLMQYHRLSFPEAVQELARRYGIPLNLKELGPDGAQQARKRTGAYEVNAAAAAFYAATLASSEGAPGRAYLKKRGLTPEVIRAFQLGYAVDQWDSLRRHLQNQGLPLELAKDVGLLMPRERGGYYDRFRNRIIFPIFDRQSRVIAFGGRTIGDGEPKYLNSPESMLYHKGRTLYGLPQAAAALRATGIALVVEGYLDLIALQVHGIGNVLATLGTALTREQVRLLKSLAEKVVLVYDGDAAGAQAMKRALPLFAQENLAVRALPLPAGLDPDSYAQAHGVELFRSAWKSGQPWFNFLLDDLIAAHGLDLEGRVRIAAELRPFVQACTDPVEKSLCLKVASERLGVAESDLRKSFSQVSPISIKGTNLASKLELNLEKKLISWILSNPTEMQIEDIEEWVNEFEDKECKSLITIIMQSFREYGKVDHSLLVQLADTDKLRHQICSLTLGNGGMNRQAFDNLVSNWHRTLTCRKLDKKCQELKEGIDAANKKGNANQVAILNAQMTEISRQLANLRSRTTLKGEDG